jgi:hypothetical protein
MTTDPDSRAELPDGSAYVLLRWEELAGGLCPWWANGHGIGLRLRLDELVAVARARHEGALDDRALKVLRSEARRTLERPRSFLARRYEDLAKQLTAAVSDERGHTPGGRTFGTVSAATLLLAEPPYRRAIYDELEHQAAKVKGWKDLLALDELVELMDAELMYLGHSRAWRTRAAARTRTELSKGKELAEALKIGLAGAGETQTMEVVLGLMDMRRPDDIKVMIETHNEDEVQHVIDGWGAEIPDEHRDYPKGAMVVTVPRATDPEAAMDRALEWFAIQRSLWRLQGGDVTLRQTVLVYEGPPPRVHVLDRPKPMELMPVRIAAYQERLTQEQVEEAEPSVLGDAFIQLVQARASIPGAAIADLWTVAEAVFSGVAAETGAGAAEVMAGLAQYLFTRDLLDWLGRAYRDLELGEPDLGQSDADWALELIATQTSDVLEGVRGDDHALTCLRTHQVLFWDTQQCLQEDLDRVHDRFSAVAARAYLVRNLVVHRGQPQRAKALAATLQPFAGLLRACLDYLAEVVVEEDSIPVTEARVASLRVRLLADDYAGAVRRGRGPERLRAAIKLG